MLPFKKKYKVSYKPQAKVPQVHILSWKVSLGSNHLPALMPPFQNVLLSPDHLTCAVRANSNGVCVNVWRALTRRRTVWRRPGCYFWRLHSAAPPSVCSPHRIWSDSNFSCYHTSNCRHVCLSHCVCVCVSLIFNFFRLDNPFCQYYFYSREIKMMWWVGSAVTACILRHKSICWNKNNKVVYKKSNALMLLWTFPVTPGWFTTSPCHHSISSLCVSVCVFQANCGSREGHLRLQ